MLPFSNRASLGIQRVMGILIWKRLIIYVGQ